MKSLLNKIVPTLLGAGVMALCGWVWHTNTKVVVAEQADTFIWKALTDHEARLRDLEHPTRGMEDEGVEPEALRAEYEGGR